MKLKTQIASTTAPDGSQLVLFRHQDDYIITVDRHDLMVSRAHESEHELARLGCAHLTTHPSPKVLIGGLGMGYTLRQALDLLSPHATVVVAELLPEIVRWNREYLGNLNNHPLADARVALQLDDVANVIHNSSGCFDAILLDVDNGPEAITDCRNNQLYTPEGIRASLRALRPNGCLAIWSAFDDPDFERRLRRETAHVRCTPAAAYKGAKTRHCCIWTAVNAKGKP